MNYQANTDDQLLRQVLSRDKAVPPHSIADEDEFDELFAMFLDDTLTGIDKERFLQTLDADDTARKKLAAYGSTLTAASADEPESESVVSLPLKQTESHRSTTQRWLSLAIAACLLIGVGTMLWAPGNGDEAVAYNTALEHLRAGEFDQTLRTIQSSHEAGIASSRLTNLEAQAIAEIPNEVAPSDGYALDRLGYEIGGTGQKNTPEEDPARERLGKAEALLKDAEEAPTAVHLNRGYLLLRMGSPAEAAKAFEKVLDTTPDDSAAWLGRGTARYMAKDFEGARDDFRQALKLDPGSIPAQINLAMALTELYEYDAALNMWQQLLRDQNLPPSKRDTIEKELDRIQEEFDTSVEVPPQRHALVVGVNACPHFRIAGQTPRALEGAHADAEEVAQLLESEFGFARKDITLLIGDQATHDAIAAEFTRLIDRVSEQDQFVFYFSGHGTQCADGPDAPLDEADDLDEALCAYDSMADGSNLVLDDDLARWFDQLRANSISVFLDCCHSGDGTKLAGGEWRVRSLSLEQVLPHQIAEEGALSELRSTKAVGRRLVALYACTSNQSAYEGPHLGKRRKMGLFTRYLISGLSGGAEAPADKNQDREVTVEELTSYISEQIDGRFNKGREPSDQQTPRADAGRMIWPVLPSINDQQPPI